MRASRFAALLMAAGAVAAPASGQTPPAPSASATAPPQAQYSVRLADLEVRIDELKRQIRRRGQARVPEPRSARVVVSVDEQVSGFRRTGLELGLDGAAVLTSSRPLGALRRDDGDDGPGVVLGAPVTPGAHELSVVVKLRGHGYGVFSYLSSYELRVRGRCLFLAPAEGTVHVAVDVVERGGPTTPASDRPRLRCRVDGREAAPEDSPDR